MRYACFSPGGNSPEGLRQHASSSPLYVFPCVGVGCGVVAREGSKLIGEVLFLIPHVGVNNTRACMCATTGRLHTQNCRIFLTSNNKHLTSRLGATNVEAFFIPVQRDEVLSI